MPYPLHVVQQIADKHGLVGEPELLPAGGMVNEAWRIGDFILRICKEEDGRDEAAREAAVVPILIEAGIRAPQLVAFDLEPELTSLPYTIYERAEGVLLGYGDFGPDRLSNAYREIGREIARLGKIAVSDSVRTVLRARGPLRPWKTLAKVLAHELIPSKDGQEIARWIETLEPKLGQPLEPTLSHMDIHPWNVFVDPERDELTAIIDWGDASWDEPAVEFASMPMQCIPAMLEGYVEEGGSVNEGFLARSLHAGLSLGLWELRELPPADFDRRWWRMPPGGWAELKARVLEQWPDLAGGWS